MRLINPHRLTKVLISKGRNSMHSYYPHKPKETWLFGLITLNDEYEAGWYYTQNCVERCYSKEELLLKYIHYYYDESTNTIRVKPSVTYYFTEKNYETVYFNTLQEAKDTVSNLRINHKLGLSIIEQ